MTQNQRIRKQISGMPTGPYKLADQAHTIVRHDPEPEMQSIGHWGMFPASGFAGVVQELFVWPHSRQKLAGRRS